MANATLCDDGSALAALATPTRNRYFYGKLLDVFHLEMEQAYGNRKRWLLNRLGLGTGVLCGLAVTPSGDGKGLVVGPGVAIDPYGREIVVPAPSPVIDPRQPTDGCGRPAGEPVGPGTSVTICLAYHECQSELVPAMVCDCDCGGDAGCQASSVRERYMVLVDTEPLASSTAGCRIPNLFQPNAGGNGLTIAGGALADFVSQACAAPSGACVPLARVTIPDASAPWTAAAIDDQVRPVVYSNELLFDVITCLAQQEATGGGAPPPPDLGHISGISWPHDGTMAAELFLEKGLTVKFDRPVGTAPQTSRTWFLVTIEYPVTDQKPGGYIAAIRVLDRASGLADPTTAEFLPDQRTIPLLANATARGERVVIRVEIRCDFLLDQKGKPIDGDFFGALPTGDGVAGGRFESWFSIPPES